MSSTIMAQPRNVIESTGVAETIHSGHFMVSQFEAEAQDDEYEVAVPVPEVHSKQLEIIPIRSVVHSNGGSGCNVYAGDRLAFSSPQKIMSVSIETSLTKLFQCMSIAYRTQFLNPTAANIIQKLTSPKWNRFKGVRLRWKEKIRLNNVIWRCWHMQFVLKRKIGVCQFASPLDVDIHSKPEAVVLEGKYWKRKLSAVTAEYKRWRLFYQKFSSSPAREAEGLNGIMDWNLQNSVVNNAMMVDEDYMSFMSDTLFSTLTQPFAFPDTREIARGASLADFIQPSLVQLQPNLDDYMDMLEPLQDLLSPSSKLPSVPEEYLPSDDLYRSLNVNYEEDMSSSAFYSHSATTAAAAAMETTSPASQSEQPKFFVKCEQEQPLQLRVSQNAIDSKMAYRSGNASNSSSSSFYPEPNSNSMYPNHRVSDSSYSTYQTPAYQQLQPGHPSGQESVAINYSHQTATKSVSSPITINFNNSSMTSSHHYSAYEPSMSYSAPTSNLSQYNPTSSSTYKILASRSLRSASATATHNEEELFLVPKLSQRGRSRSGSNLILNQGRYMPSEHCNAESGAHGYQSNYQSSNTSCCGTPNYDSRGCYVINGHRQVPYCTALLGRRSRTPDHILSTTSNPVGYCKPRIPSLSSQDPEDDSLPDFPSDKSKIPEKLNGIVHPHLYTAGRRLSQCLPRGAYEKYPNSTSHVQTWASTGSYQTTNFPPAQSSVSSSGAPFVFTGNQQTHSHMDVSSPGLSQMMSNAGTSESPRHPSSPSTSESLSLSPLAAGSPIRGTPPSPTAKSSSVTPYKEHRRVCHINAEQKRRCNIKNGFDTLHVLIPHLIQNPNSKMSKAAMLQKGAEYIQQLRSERTQLREEIECLKQQVDTLNSAISNCQSMLPATGAPVSGHKADKINEMFDEYVREKTKQNWKFWILSLIVQPLLVSFNASVSTSSFEDLCRTTIQWAEQYCSLIDLRPVALNALRHLSAKTDAITSPHRLPDEVQAIVLNTSSKSNKN